MQGNIDWVFTTDQRLQEGERGRHVHREKESEQSVQLCLWAESGWGKGVSEQCAPAFAVNVERRGMIVLKDKGFILGLRHADFGPGLDRFRQTRVRKLKEDQCQACKHAYMQHTCLRCRRSCSMQSGEPWHAYLFYNVA